MIRPEAKRALWRWREVLFGITIAALGYLWVTSYFGLLRWLGIVLFIIGGALLYIGFQRGRFRSDQDGPGVIQVVEGQIAYFGPSEGGLVAIPDITRISLVTHNSARWWKLEQSALPTIYIPVTAKGTDQLFDAFATLPGLGIESMVQKLTQDTSQSILIWERTDISSSKNYLH